jgi:hypothetical protein
VVESNVERRKIYNKKRGRSEREMAGKIEIELRESNS